MWGILSVLPQLWSNLSTAIFSGVSRNVPPKPSKHRAKLKPRGPPSTCKKKGCTTPNYSGGLCRKHGAPRKICQIEGCTTPAYSGGLCKKHGAKGKPRPTCKKKGCTTTARSGGLCSAHGGGRRCEAECCAHNDSPDSARFIYEGKHVCWVYAASLVENARLEGRTEDFKHLRRKFGMKKDQVMRAEQAVLFEIFKRFDASFSKALHRYIDRPCQPKKDPSAPKPDALFVFKGGFGLHLEHDETLGHERCEDRLAKIHRDARTSGKTAVIRWCERRGLRNAMCKKRQRKAPGSPYTNTFYELTKRGIEVIDTEIVPVIRAALEAIESGTQGASIHYINFYE